MSDSVLKRYTGARALGAREDSLENGSDPIDDLGCFSWLRGIRDRAPMIEFRRKDGRSVAYDYTLLRKVVFDPSEGITLKFDSETVYIEGRNLDDESTPGIQLLRGILYHRVPWVREMSEAELMGAPENAAVIERFDFEESE